ncbi:hypothetical protein AB0G29_14300 [Streptomyces parvus]|uniref:hypothetical protein n=1 Tax=Streptomyces parvus TaxID=66428 RepID=UPI0033C08B6C
MLDVVHLHQEAEPGGDAAEERRPFGESGGHTVLVDLEGAQELPEHRGEVDHSVPPVVRQVDVEPAVGEESWCGSRRTAWATSCVLPAPPTPTTSTTPGSGPAAGDRPASRRPASSFVRCDTLARSRGGERADSLPGFRGPEPGPGLAR